MSSSPSPEGTKTDSEKGLSSSCELSDNTCSICIDEIKEMCYTDTCLHRFCFTCLSEWVKRKQVCPLCKAEFTNIIHNVKSDDEYEMTPLFPHELVSELEEQEEALNDEDEQQARQLQLLELGDLREDIMWLQLEAGNQSPEIQQIRREISENLVSVIDDVGTILDRL